MRRSIRRPARLLWLAVILALFATACDDGGADEPTDTAPEDTAAPDTADDLESDAQDTTVDDDVEPLPEGPTVVFDLAAAGDDFFAFPYPNALRTTAEGAPAVRDLVDASSALGQSLVDEIETHVRGFSPQTAVYFQLEAALDPASLPQTPADATAEDATAYLLNVEPESPAYLQRHPVRVHFSTEANAVAPGNLLVIEPVPGQPLRGGERYVAALTRGLILADGSPIGAQPSWEAIKVSVLPPTGVLPEVHTQVRGLLAELGDAGVAVDDLVVATPFTTSDPRAAFDALYDGLDNAPFAPPTTFDVVEETAAHALYEGTISIIEYVDVSAPTTPGPLLARAADGTPQQVRTVETSFAVMTMPMPPEDVVTYPMVIAVPPAGGDHRAWLATLGGEMVRTSGVATIAYEPPLTGSRNPTAGDVDALIDEVVAQNPLGWRDLVLQGVAEQIQLYRLVQVLTIPAELSPSGVQLQFTAEPVISTAVGLSGQSLALLSGTWPLLDSVTLSQVGAGLGAMLVAREGVGAQLATALGVAGDTLDASHPLVSLVLQPALDIADPVYIADRAFLDPIGVPKDVLLTLGTDDARVSARSIETLAVALGVPPVEPVPAGSGALWEAAGIDALAAPVQANILAESPDCTRDPCQITAGAVSYPLGHDLLLSSPDALTVWVAWIRGAFISTPEIPATP